MKRLFGVFTVLCLSIVVLTYCVSPAVSAERIVINFAHHQQPDSPAGLGAQRLAERLIERSGGRLDVRMFPAEQLGSESSVFDQLGGGLVGMSTLGFGIIGSMAPSALAMEMGYMFADYNHLSNFLESDAFDEIVREAIDRAGIRIGSAYYNGVRHTTTSSAIFSDPASFAGVRIRVPNSEMLIATFEAMGSAPTPMAFGEVYMGLSIGAIDGQENPIPTIMSMRFFEVQNHLFLTGHMVQAVTFVISEATYQSLPEDLKQIVIEEMRAEAVVTSEFILQREAQQLEELKELGMEVHEVNAEAFAEAVKAIIPRFESRWGEGLFDRIQATR